jgi:hypothetical protein
MDSEDAASLRDVIAVALACAPRGVKKAYADRYDPKQQDASRQLTDSVVKAIAQYFHTKANPIRPNATPPMKP